MILKIAVSEIIFCFPSIFFVFFLLLSFCHCSEIKHNRTKSNNDIRKFPCYFQKFRQNGKSIFENGYYAGSEKILY